MPQIRVEDLPQEVQAVISPQASSEGGRASTLASISKAIAKLRDEAKEARSSSGIEAVWTAMEEAYVGIDDANREEYQNAKWAKPPSMTGPVTTGREQSKDESHASTVFVRLTARYVDAGSSKLGEILLPIDDKAFSFSETPVPDLIKAKENNSPVILDNMGGAPAMRPLKPGEQPPNNVIPFPTPGAAPSMPAPAPAAAPAMGAVPPAGAAGPPQQQMVPLTVKDLAEENIEIARKKAKLAEQRIYDWMVECGHTAEMRKVIFDSSRIGVGVVKAPVPKVYKGIATQRDAKTGAVSVKIKETVKPSTKWVDPWNFFPDPTCGEDVHNGEYAFERDHLSEAQVRALAKLPGYIKSQLVKIIELGPPKDEKDKSTNPLPQEERKGRYEIWYFYGMLKKEDMECIGTASGQKEDKLDDQTFAIVTMIGDEVVKATINPLTTGKHPYNTHPWQRRAGHWAGIGVGEQCKTPQAMINAATRAMLNNAGISAGGQIILDRGSIMPADKKWNIYPNKIWYKQPDTTGDDVSKAFTIVEIPNQTDPMMKIINYSLQLAEESTSIPLVTQGQSGATTPDTFGAAQLQNNNANQLLRAVGYSYDDYITDPVVIRYYEWLLLDPDVPDDEKGDWTIHAHGSVALVERAIQDQTIAQMAGVAKDPAYGINPRKWSKVYLKSKRIDPDDLLYTEEEQAKIDAQPPPPEPAVQVAQIAASTADKKLVAEQTSDQRTAANETSIANAAHALEGGRVLAEHERSRLEAVTALHDMQTRKEIAHLEYALKHNMTITQIRAELAKTAMTLETQRDLNAVDNAVDLHKHHTQPPKPAGAKSPGQTPGKAGKGRSFEQGPQR